MRQRCQRISSPEGKRGKVATTLRRSNRKRRPKKCIVCPECTERSDDEKEEMSTTEYIETEDDEMKTPSSMTQGSISMSTTSSDASMYSCRSANSDPLDSEDVIILPRRARSLPDIFDIDHDERLVLEHQTITAHDALAITDALYRTSAEISSRIEYYDAKCRKLREKDSINNSRQREVKRVAKERKKELKRKRRRL